VGGVYRHDAVCTFQAENGYVAQAQIICKSLNVIGQTFPDEIESRHSSLGGEFGERIAVVEDVKHRLRRREP
jgi:hypothetical protein